MTSYVSSKAHPKYGQSDIMSSRVDSFSPSECSLNDYDLSKNISDRMTDQVSWIVETLRGTVSVVGKIKYVKAPFLKIFRHK